mmetsp:Transcript_4859/g.10706  ORF Transcript_4859/g.10706 Transcript_4859/m.10706 type:complete len:240 (-) Transcript_4859:327-1046(-)
MKPRTGVGGRKSNEELSKRASEHERAARSMMAFLTPSKRQQDGAIVPAAPIPVAISVVAGEGVAGESVGGEGVGSEGGEGAAAGEGDGGNGAEDADAGRVEAEGAGVNGSVPDASETDGPARDGSGVGSTVAVEPSAATSAFEPPAEVSIRTATSIEPPGLTIAPSCPYQPSELELQLGARNDQLWTLLRFIKASKFAGLGSQKELADRICVDHKKLAEFMSGRVNGRDLRREELNKRH